VVTATNDIITAAVMTRYHHPEVWTVEKVVEYHRTLDEAQLRVVYGDNTVDKALTDLAAQPRLYVDATEAGIRAIVSYRLGQEHYEGHTFLPGEDRSPYYEQCEHYDRYAGGSLLHPSARAPGPCYEDENDATGSEPE